MPVTGLVVYLVFFHHRKLFSLQSLPQRVVTVDTVDTSGDIRTDRQRQYQCYGQIWKVRVSCASNHHHRVAYHRATPAEHLMSHLKGLGAPRSGGFGTHERRAMG